MQNSHGKPIRSDFLKLKKLYLSAIESLPEITEGHGGPVYPAPVDIFIEYIRSSIWYSGTYDHEKLRYVRSNINAATFDDLGSLFRGFVRAEHWVPGAWRHEFEGNDLKKAIERADELTKQISG
jgi:hypothetical protein